MSLLKYCVSHKNKILGLSLLGVGVGFYSTLQGKKDPRVTEKTAEEPKKIKRIFKRVRSFDQIERKIENIERRHFLSLEIARIGKNAEILLKSGDPEKIKAGQRLSDIVSEMSDEYISLM